MEVNSNSIGRPVIPAVIVSSIAKHFKPLESDCDHLSYSCGRTCAAAPIYGAVCRRFHGLRVKLDLIVVSTYPGKGAVVLRGQFTMLHAARHRLLHTHSSKHGRKYRYYVSAPMIRNAKVFPDGLRVPAADLEKMVINAIAAKLRDQKWVTSTLAEKTAASELSPMIDRAVSLAKQVEGQTVLNDGSFRTIINRVEVSKSTISIKLDLDSIAATLLPNGNAEPFASRKNNAFHIVVSGQFLRCGKQVRLVIGNNATDQREPDKRLIQEILRAQS